MDKHFKQIPVSKLRVKLPKLRQQVQLGNLRLVCTHYGEVLGFLLPLQDVEAVNKELIRKSEEMPLTKKVNINKILSSQAIKHEWNHRHLNKGLADFGQSFIIFTQASLFT